MAEYGLLVDYEWCTGCHSCEMACAVEPGFPQGQCGVVVCEVGPGSYGPENGLPAGVHRPVRPVRCAHG